MEGLTNWVRSGAVYCVRSTWAGRAAEGAGRRRGRIPAVTSRPPSALDIHLARSPAPPVPFHGLLAIYLPLLLLLRPVATTIYLRWS